jgi:KipI family sensor histidine kinase inhibitor
MPRASHTRDQAPNIARAGESAVIVRLGERISPTLHKRVLALLATLDATPPVGLRDLVPAYASLLIHFDPLATTADAIEEHVRRVLAGPTPARPRRGRTIRIPVRYGGVDGPDLDAVAACAGLPPEEVARRHAAAEYRVYFLGFLAGFPYLGGLPNELAVPRLSSPRARVSAGSVGIAGQQTGIYPVASPGGWRLIGRTPLRLFDPARDPPALLRPGDHVRFSPILERNTEDAEDTRAEEEYASRSTILQGSVPWLRVVRAGPLTSVQDLGRPGYARYGVSACGAADADALRLGNALLGNPLGAAGLEVTLGSAQFETLAPCAVAVVGAECDACVSGRPLRRGAAAALAPGDTLQLGLARAGARAYLCVAGGVAVAPALGSRSTDLRAGLGGLAGRALRAGDVLARGEAHRPHAALAGRHLPPDPLRDATERGSGPVTVRTLPGPHAATCPDDLEALAAGVFAMDPRSDRLGVRLRRVDENGSARLVGGETLSEGVPRGAVQLPPGGEPIILLADHQTTGGYRAPAVVIAADLWLVAQLRAGDTLRLAPTTHEASVAALRARRAWVEDLVTSFSDAPGVSAPHPRGPDAALLMRGFVEWSEEAQEDE